MSTSPSLLAAAVRAGVVSAEDAGRGAVLVAPMARSNPVHRIDRSGAPVAFVKQQGAAARLDGDDTAAVEGALLDLLAPWGFTPTVVREGGPRSVWMAPVAGIELGLLAGSTGLHVVAAELGRVLAMLHRVPPGQGTPVAPVPWPLRDVWPASMSGSVPPVAERVREVCGRASVRAALDHARGQWSTTHVIHGDIAPANVLVEMGPAGTATLNLIDLELGGLGQPAVDVVSARAALGALGSDPGALVAAFEASYAAHGGPGRIGPEWLVVRSLMTAWQLAAASETMAEGLVEPRLDQLLRTALECADRVPVGVS